MKKNKEALLVKIHEEVNRELANPEVMNSLMTTTFNGLTEKLTKQAILEGMIRGFTFQDFMKKDVYAIPFKSRNGTLGYSLITSIAYARKVGARSGIVGTKAPEYELDKDGKIISCSVTVLKKTGNYIGEFTAKVFFDEYDKKENLWVTKKRTMIAKVADMHALRIACPEELAQVYVEEEIGKEVIDCEIIQDNLIEESILKLHAIKTEEELKTVWANIPVEHKIGLASLKDELKTKFK